MKTGGVVMKVWGWSGNSMERPEMEGVHVEISITSEDGEGG